MDPWGYNRADPNADPGRVYLSGVDALSRLVGVGTEWASYATVGGLGRRAVAREAGEEASKRLAPRAAGQAGKELKPVVIGENMRRVETYARQIGAGIITDWIPSNAWTLEKNIAWIRQMMREGRYIIDIGPHFERRWRFVRGLPGGRPPSDAYAIERRLLKGYPRYEKRFIRSGRYGGGVPGLNIGDDWATEPFFP